MTTGGMDRSKARTTSSGGGANAPGRFRRAKGRSSCTPTGTSGAQAGGCRVHASASVPTKVHLTRSQGINQEGYPEDGSVLAHVERSTVSDTSLTATGTSGASSERLKTEGEVDDPT